MTDSPTPPAQSSPAASWIGPVLTAAFTAVVLVVVALEGGGFDVVPRQTVAVVLWWAVVIGALLMGRRLTIPTASSLVATGAILGLSIWAGLTIGGSLSAERSAVEVARWAAYAAPVLLVGWVLPRELWRSVVAGLTIAGTVIALLALGERLSPGLLSDTRTVVFENQAQRLVEPLGYWNALGSWGAMTGLLLLGSASHLRHWVPRALALAPLPAVGLMVYVTYSRSSILVTFFGLAVLLALSRNRWTVVVQALAAAAGIGVAVSVLAGKHELATATGNAGAGSVLVVVILAGLVLMGVGAATALLGADRLRLPYRLARTATITAGVATVAAVAILAVTVGPGAWDTFSKQEEANSTTDPTARLTMVSNGTRVEQWRIALDSWEADKWTGTGAGTYEFTYNRRGTDSDFVRDAHSAPLEALSEQGIIGFALLIALMLSAAVAGVSAVLRSKSDADRGLLAGATAAVGAFFLGSCFDWFWEVGALAVFATTLIGVLAAASSCDLPPTRRFRGLPGLVAALAVVGVLVQLPGLVGTSEIRRSQQAVAAGDIEDARAHANEAIDIQPWAASPFLQRALVDEQDGAWASAAAALRLGIGRDPYDWRLPLVLARVEAKRGNAEEALAAYRAAKRLRPNGRFFQ